MVNRIQKERKEQGFEVTDRIRIEIEASELVSNTVESFGSYIAEEVLASDINVVPSRSLKEDAFELDVNGNPVKLTIQKA